MTLRQQDEGERDWAVYQIVAGRRDVDDNLVASTISSHPDIVWDYSTPKKME